MVPSVLVIWFEKTKRFLIRCVSWQRRKKMIPKLIKSDIVITWNKRGNMSFTSKFEKTKDSSLNILLVG